MKRKVNVEEKMSLELKYCERCGGLWLRPAGGGQIYCASCAKQIAEMPPASGRFDSSSEKLAGSEVVIQETNEFCRGGMFEEFAGGEF
jgi:Zn-finger nucleic acid-binding protein